MTGSASPVSGWHRGAPGRAGRLDLDIERVRVEGMLARLGCPARRPRRRRQRKQRPPVRLFVAVYPPVEAVRDAHRPGRHAAHRQARRVRGERPAHPARRPTTSPSPSSARSTLPAASTCHARSGAPAGGARDGVSSPPAVVRRRRTVRTAAGSPCSGWTSPATCPRSARWRGRMRRELRRARLPTTANRSGRT